MGLDTATLHALENARDHWGLSFDGVLTIGRQELAGSVEAADARLRDLGAQVIAALDVSAFEGATIRHDLNTPLPVEHHEQFSLVLDGGSLEHVFDVPQALRNYMAAVKVGGHLVIVVPGNNQMGHGFYQFSPELFFRVFTKANGFQMRGVWAYEVPFTGTWYAVADPAVVQTRVTLTNRKPVQLILIAQKLAAAPFITPQQSDYTRRWQGETPRPESRLIAFARRIYLRLQPFGSRFYTPIRYFHSPNPLHYR